MRFLTDENIASSVVIALRKAGHNVFDVKEAGWHAVPDTKLIDYAIKNKRIILTHDKDFIYQEKVPIILMRFQNQKPDNVQKYLLIFLKSTLVKKLKRPIVLLVSEYGVVIYK